MLMLPSLAMAQGQVTRKPKPDPVKPTHTHSVNGPKNCRECNRLRRHTHSISGPEWCVECNRQREEERQRVAKQRRREEELRLAEERKRKEKEEAKLAEQKRKEEERLAEERERKAAEEKELAEKKRIIDNIINNMVYVEGGTFTMGATPEQRKDYIRCEKDEFPKHKVTLSSYYIGRYEVTQTEWETVMGNNPSYFKRGDRPVTNVSWNDCQDFIRKINTFTGKKYRLPTEAEWEFAARGGNKSRGYIYSGCNNLDSVAWHERNVYNQMAYPVGLKNPNELGLYDMTGNVAEWCQDWYGDYSSAPQVNPEGPITGTYRVIRGGSMSFVHHISFRNYQFQPKECDSHIGLRLAM